MHNLRILASVIGLTIVLLSSRAQAASFIIELNNGREVTTSHVWEEGDELKFYLPQGTAGIPKALVKGIKTSTLLYHKVTWSSLPPNTTDASASTMGRPSQTHAKRDPEIRQEAGNSQLPPGNKHDRDKGLEEGDAQVYRGKKLMLTSALDAATNTYLAASGAKNPDAKQAALDDMREHAQKIVELGDEVQQKNGGVLPDWWNE